MQKLTLNIGLNNCPLTAPKVADKIRLALGSDFSTYRIARGIYNGEHESTAVLVLGTRKKLSYIVDMVERIASDLQQECIAVSCDSFELLIYSPSYKGEKMKFNNNYFINL